MYIKSTAKAALAAALSDAMRFAPLYDSERNLFYIGRR